MNKKQMKKEQERLKRERNQVYMDFNDKNDIKKVLYVSLGVIGFVLIVFVVINIFNGTWNLFTRENDPISDQGENRVMCGTLLNRNDTEYLVLAYDFENDKNTFYPVLKDTYTMFEKIYELDLHSGFNKACVGDKTNITSDIKKLKLSGPTLLKVKDNKIVESYTTKETIKNYFSKYNNITK